MRSLDRLGAEAAEDDVVRRADARAREHRHDDLGDHRQVDPDDVALLDAVVLQRVGEALDVAVQLGVGDVALLALLAAPVERHAVAVAGLDVAIQAVVGGVELAAGRTTCRTAGWSRRAPSCGSETSPAPRPARPTTRPGPWPPARGPRGPVISALAERLRRVEALRSSSSSSCCSRSVIVSAMAGFSSSVSMRRLVSAAARRAGRCGRTSSSSPRRTRHTTPPPPWRCRPSRPVHDVRVVAGVADAEQRGTSAPAAGTPARCRRRAQRRDEHVRGEDAPGDQVQADRVAGVGLWDVLLRRTARTPRTTARTRRRT